MDITKLDGLFRDQYIMPYHNVIDPRIQHAMQYAYILAMESINAPAHIAGGAWQYLLMRYAEPHRCYHVIGHVAAMLQAADQIGWFSPDAAEKGIKLGAADILAIFFHDVVYTVGAPHGVNERESAEVLRDLGLYLKRPGVTYVNLHDQYPMETEAPGHDTVEYAAKIVISTAAFMATESIMPGAQPVMDLDLSSFAMEYEHFENVNNAVRNELGISMEQHAKFFESMLTKPQIFHLATNWEKPARFNLQRYIREAKQVAR